MRISILFLFLFSISFLELEAQITLSTQAEVDAWDQSITNLSGDLTITGNDITNVDALSNLTSIDGKLRLLENNMLSNIDGLSNLDSISGSFLIGKNNLLTNLDGLSSLTSISGFYINENAALTNLDGLSSLISPVFGSIYRNPALTNIDGLSNLTEVSHFQIIDNVALTNIDGLSGLTSFEVYMRIINNDALTNIDGLSGLTNIEDKLEIEENDALTNIDGLSGLTSIQGSLTIGDNFSLTNVDGLSGLTVVEGSLTIDGNSGLTNVDGLSGLTSIYSLSIVGSGLSNVDGLSGLTSVEGSLLISIWGSSLTNIDGLSGLTSVEGSLTIYASNVDGLSGLTSVEGSLSISGATNVDGLSNIISLTGTLNIGAGVPNIDGLSGLTNIEGRLYLSSYELTDVDGLSNVTSISGILEISHFYAFQAALTNIDGLSNLTSLEGSIELYNISSLKNVDGLSGLTSIEGSLSITGRQWVMGNIDGLSNVNSISGTVRIGAIEGNYALTNVDGLSGLTSLEGELFITGNDALTNIDGLSSLTSIEGSLFIYGNGELINVDGLSSLSSISGTLEIGNSYNNYSLTNVDGLSGLTTLEGDLLIRNNQELTNIDGLYNLESIEGSLTIEKNWDLSECCALAKFEDNPNVHLRYNDTGCHSMDQIIEYCTFPFLEGKIQFDSSGSCNEDSGIIMPASFTIQDDSEEYKKWSHFIDNKYKVILPVGSYEIKPCFDTTLFVSTPEVIDVTFSQDGDSLQRDFCLVPTPLQITDLMISVIPIDIARPGFNAHYNIIIENLGNTPSSGSVVLEIPQNIVEIISSSDTYTLNGNQISWSYTDLSVLSRKTISFVTRTNSPMDIPAINSGDILKFKAEVIPNLIDANRIDNITSLCQIAVNSYDPNDKRCLQGSFLDVERVGTFLDYMIRFENTGTAEAVRIKVKDILDTMVYDISSLRFVEASHSVDVSLKDNLLEFLFEDINLSHLDSLNDGFIVFKIKTRDDLQIGDYISNKASIYFDFNWPILTDEATTLVVTDNDGDGFYSVEDCNDNDSSIFPGATETCDNIDNNCDGQIDEGLDLATYYLDQDQDGYGDDDNVTEECNQPKGTVSEGGDCDDSDPTINPEAEDFPNNGIDENCDGMDAISSTFDLKKLDISIYPNPVDDFLFIEQSSRSELNITLFDTSGKKVLKNTVSATSNSIDLSRNPDGLYFLSIEKTDQVIYQKVVIK